MKLNIYTCVKLWKNKHYVESVLILLNLQLFCTHLWVNVSMGLVFVVAILRDCVRGLRWCVDVALRRRENVKWALEKTPEAADVISNNDNSSSSSGATPVANPMLHASDVELGNMNKNDDTGDTGISR